MRSCYLEGMRTTIDVPDALFRKTKALAALRGESMKDFIQRALEREVTGSSPQSAQRSQNRVTLPLVHLKSGRRLDLTDFDFDDLLP